MTADTIRKNIDDGAYQCSYPKNLPAVPPEGTVIDANMTVNWNREQIEQRKKLRDMAIKAYYEKEAELYNLFKKHVCEYIIEETGVNNKRASIVFNKAYSDGHAGGFHEVLSHTQTLIDFITDFMEAENDV